MSGEGARFQITDALWIHGVWAFNGTQIACACDHHFRSTAEHRDHLADALLSGPLAPLLAAQAAVQRVEALLDEAADQGWNGTTHNSRIRAALDGPT